MNNTKLLDTIKALSSLVEQAGLNEAQLLERAVPLIAALVAEDDWLPAELATPHPQYYQQHLLYGDPQDRFSLVSFVWGPGQTTPIHDHTVWGIIGMLRGAEVNEPFRLTGQGVEPDGPAHTLQAGEVACVSPSLGDVHRVSNAHDDQVSVSVHLYGGNIGRITRSVYDADTGAQKAFVSGYSNTMVPNLWVSQA